MIGLRCDRLLGVTRSPVLLALAALAAATCTATHPAPSATPAEAREEPPASPSVTEQMPAPAASPSEPEQMPAPVPTVARPWVWYHAPPAWVVDAPVFGLGLLDRSRFGDPPLLVTATRGPDGVLVDAGGQWQRTIAGEGEAPVVLATAPDGVRVGMRTGAGARVVAFTGTGAPRYDVALPAAGVTAVQLEQCGPSLCVYTRGDRGALFELADVGRIEGAAEVEGALLVADPKPPAGAIETRALGERWRFGARSYAVVAEGKRVALVRRDREAVAWRTVLPDVRPFHDHAGVVEAGELAVVVFHSPIASGVTVWGVDVATGVIQWQSHPPGIGLVAHSKYRNRVWFVLAPAGLLSLHGEESSGSYVARIKAADGLVISDEIWRR
jgi:hypothetical protein